MWCVDDCYITSKIPFTSNRKVQLRVLPYVSWCLIQCCVILPIFTSGVFTRNSEDFTRICTFDLWWNYVIFIANQLFLGSRMIGTFAPREMPLFSRNFERNNKFRVSGDCNPVIVRRGPTGKNLTGPLSDRSMFLNTSRKTKGKARWGHVQFFSHTYHKGVEWLHISNSAQHIEKMSAKGQIVVYVMWNFASMVSAFSGVGSSRNLFMRPYWFADWE